MVSFKNWAFLKISSVHFKYPFYKTEPESIIT